jgi:hypothetical protein
MAADASQLLTGDAVLSRLGMNQGRMRTSGGIFTRKSRCYQLVIQTLPHH